MMGKLRFGVMKGVRGGRPGRGSRVNMTFSSKPDTSKQTVSSKCAKYHRHKRSLG